MVSNQTRPLSPPLSPSPPASSERERECVELRALLGLFALPLGEEREGGRAEMSKMAAGAADAAQQQQLAAGEAAAVRVRPVETLLRAAPLGLCVAAMAVMLKD